MKTVRRNTYVIPSLAYEGMNLGLGIGLVGATERFTVESGEQVRIDPSFHFRAGPRDLVYFEISYMEALPLYSGGGLASIGFGAVPSRADAGRLRLGCFESRLVPTALSGKANAPV